MFAPLIGFFAKSVLMQSPAGALLKRIPRQVWLVLAIVALLVAAFFWHQHKAHSAIDSAVKAAVSTAIDKRDGQWRAQLAKAHGQAIAERDRSEANGRKIATDTKGIHDEAVRNNAGDARDLFLRGAGKAAAPAGCRPGDYPGLSAAAGRYVDHPSGADAAAAEMHPGNGLAGVQHAPGGILRSGPASTSDGAFAIVPWSWLTEQGRQFDDLLAEAKAWRTWHPKEAAEWERLRGAARTSALPEPEKGGPNVR